MKKAKKKACKHKVQVRFRYSHAPDEADHYKGCVHCGLVRSADGGVWHTFPYRITTGSMLDWLIEEHERQHKKESDAM